MREVHLFLRPTFAGLRQIEVVRRSDLVGEAHHRKHKGIARRFNPGNMLALAEDHGSDSNPPGVLQRVAEQGVGFDAGLAVRLKVVRLVEIEVSDLARWYEKPNVERLGGRNAGLLKVLGGHENVL